MVNIIIIPFSRKGKEAEQSEQNIRIMQLKVNWWGKWWFENTDRTGNYDTLRNPSSVQYFNNREKCRGLHPTQKPVALMEYLIKTYTNEGETVLDFTMGSGTTGVAAKNLNRQFIGIDISPEYCEMAQQRLNKCGRQIYDWATAGRLPRGDERNTGWQRWYGIYQPTVQYELTDKEG